MAFVNALFSGAQRDCHATDIAFALHNIQSFFKWLKDINDFRRRETIYLVQRHFSLQYFRNSNCFIDCSSHRCKNDLFRACSLKEEERERKNNVSYYNERRILHLNLHLYCKFNKICSTKIITLLTNRFIA